jgi:hypothetical protein
VSRDPPTLPTLGGAYLLVELAEGAFVSRDRPLLTLGGAYLCVELAEGAFVGGGRLVAAGVGHLGDGGGDERVQVQGEGNLVHRVRRHFLETQINNLDIQSHLSKTNSQGTGQNRLL